MLLLRELLPDLVEPVVRLLDRALRVRHLLFELADLGHDRRVRLQQHLRLLGDALVDALHLFLARGGALHLRELVLQLGDLRLQLLHVGRRDAAGRAEQRGRDGDRADGVHGLSYLTSTRCARRFFAHSDSSWPGSNGRSSP